MLVLFPVLTVVNSHQPQFQAHRQVNILFGSMLIQLTYSLN